MAIDRTDTEERLARIDKMIEEYRADQQRQLLQQASKCRRLAEAHKRRVGLEEPAHVQ